MMWIGGLFGGDTPGFGVFDGVVVIDRMIVGGGLGLIAVELVDFRHAALVILVRRRMPGRPARQLSDVGREQGRRMDERTFLEVLDKGGAGILHACPCRTLPVPAATGTT